MRNRIEPHACGDKHGARGSTLIDWLEQDRDLL